MSQANRTRPAPAGHAAGATSIPGAAVSSADLSASAGLPFGPLRRDPESAALTGVCAVAAQHCGVDPLLIRAVTVITALSGGVGVVLYAGLWAMTPERGSDSAPLDRLLPHWRTWTPKAQWGALFGLTTAFALVAGSLTPLGWGPAAVIGMLIWYANRSAQRHPTLRPAAPSALLPRDVHPVTPRSRLAGPLSTLGVLIAATLVAAAVWHRSPVADDQHRLTLAISTALLVVGVGLLLRVRRHGSPTLVLTGLALSATIFAPLLPAPPLPESAHSYLTTNDLPADPIEVTAQKSRLDFSRLTIADDATIQIEATASDLVLLLPHSMNVEITGDFVASTVTMPNGPASTLAQSGASWRPPVHLGAPTLHLSLDATMCNVKVLQ